MSVKELIEYLQKLPPETNVMVKQEYTRNWETGTRWVNGDFSRNIDWNVDTVFLGE